MRGAGARIDNQCEPLLLAFEISIVFFASIFIIFNLCSTLASLASFVMNENIDFSTR
jgi:hypothetical protein